MAAVSASEKKASAKIPLQENTEHKKIAPTLLDTIVRVANTILAVTTRHWNRGCNGKARAELF